MNNRIPSLIIIGAQKSASTYIHDCLGDHPDIYMIPGEIPFFESPDFENHKIEDLYKHFEGRTETILGFKRPNYLGKPEVPERIKRFLPDAKLIVILRNPIERSLSALYHNMNYGFLPLGDPNEMMKKIFKDEEILGFPRADEVKEFGFYYKYLQLYQEFYDKGNLLILKHEDIKKDKNQIIEKVYRFVGVDSAYRPQNIDSKPQSVVYNLKRLKFLRLKNNLIYNYNEERTRLKKKKGLFFILIREIFVQFDALFLGKLYKNKKEVLKESTLKLIYNTYKSDIEMLEKKYGFDLSEWKM